MSNTLKPVLARLAAGATLTETEAEHAFDIIMSGEATPAQIGGLLMAMRVRGESVAELTGAVRALRARMATVAAPDDAMDVCGTGGDNAGTLNISTAVTFVVAGAGVPVAKHGNRALSSRTGGADVLTALGVNVDVPLDRLPDILRAAGCAFLFAPRHHPSMRHAAGPRVELGTRTIFNLLGPLSNPAGVRRQFTGVFAPEWARPMAETLARLGTEAAWIVHGQGLDELTVAGESQVVALRDGSITQLRRQPRRCRPEARADRGDQRRRCGAERLRAAGVVGGRARPLSRHRVAERRRRPDRGRPYRRTAGGVGAGRPGAAVGCGTRRAGTAAARNQSAAAVALSATYRRGEPMANDMPAGTEAGSGSDVLARICGETLTELARRKAEISIDRLRQAIAAQGRPAPWLRPGAEARHRRRTVRADR